MDWLEAYDREMQSEAVEAEKLDFCNRAIRAFLDGQDGQTVIADYLRVSQLYDFCPRAFVINYWNPIPSKFFDPSAIFKMNIGTFLHSYLQDRVLGPMGVLWGTWTRKISPSESGDMEGGYEEVVGFHPDPEKALWELSNERPLSWHFQEETLWTEKYRIKGHCDGRVSLDRFQWFADNARLTRENLKIAYQRVRDIPEGKISVLEIKSLGTKGYKEWQKPEETPPYYKSQACMYQQLASLKETSFLLMDRDTCTFKGMIYPYEKGWVADAKYKAQIVWESIRDEVLPKSMMACRTPADKRAKSCAFADICWNNRLDVKKWIAECKARQPDRQFLDLSGLVYED